MMIDDSHTPVFYCWRCPTCGGTLVDVVEMMRQDGGLQNEIVLEITRDLVRSHCLQCDSFFGEQELKDRILST